MAFDVTLAATRFGYGLSPSIAAPRSVADMLDQLRGPDLMAQRFPIPVYVDVRPKLSQFRDARQARNDAKKTGKKVGPFVDRLQQLKAQGAAQRMQNHLSTIARAVDAHDALRERLVAFWADHFTVIARQSAHGHLVTPYVEDAIRPHVTGNFQDMVKAVATHPMMLIYLEQTQSFGPNSVRGKKTSRGLNENLAREMLELHLLGVGGGYTQADVSQMAELLTGLTYNPHHGFKFDATMAEPGAETILGVRFSEKNSLRNVLRALEKLALQPQTTQFLATRMASHFVADTPDKILVTRMAQAYSESKGNLMAMTSVMLQSSAAWHPTRRKVHTPQGFITSAMRALGVRGNDLLQLTKGPYKRLIDTPSKVMGQPFEQPNGPDGWPERAEDWITPQGMAGRITWALNAPRNLVRPLPDPREFVVTALGPDAPSAVVFAAGAAEAVPDGIGIVLSSAAFQRI